MTLVIYLDDTKKRYRKITPAFQGAEYNSKERFDGNWVGLVTHFYGERRHKKYHSFEVK